MVNDKGIIYLLAENIMRHASNIVVSLFSLRKYYNGNITVLVNKDNENNIPKKIVNDPNINANVKVIDLLNIRHRSNACYLIKSNLNELTPYQYTLFLDADTLILNDINELWPINNEEFVLTQLGNYLTCQKIPRKRWDRYKLAPKDCEYCWSNPVPYCNDGVFAFPRDHPLMNEWKNLAYKLKDSFSPSETSLNTIHYRFKTRILSSNYNYWPKTHFDLKNVKIIHYACGTNFNKSGGKVFRETLLECFDKNIGNINEWCDLEYRKKFI